MSTFSFETADRSVVCSCGSGLTLGECCAPIMEGSVVAATPEALMRSRYTAYAVGAIDWLKESLDPSQRGDFDEKAVETWSRNSEWMGLEIRRTEADDTTGKGLVEFIARFKADGVIRNHHELGEFRKANGKWYFLDGKGIKPEPIRHVGPVVGRNDPCTCGSGKKYKKCCGSKV